MFNARSLIVLCSLSTEPITTSYLYRKLTGQARAVYLFNGRLRDENNFHFKFIADTFSKGQITF